MEKEKKLERNKGKIEKLKNIHKNDEIFADEHHKQYNIIHLNRIERDRANIERKMKFLIFDKRTKHRNSMFLRLEQRESSRCPAIATLARL